MERAEILTPVFENLPSKKNPWPRFLGSNFDVPVRFIVLQADIVPRPVLFNESVFKKQRFFFTAGNEYFYVGKLGKQEANLHSPVTAAGILAYTGAQIFCFAHINDPPLASLKR
jgi:hypothetical protein